MEPNDGFCHLDEDGYYTYSLLQDYPSIAQVREILNFNLIKKKMKIIKIPEEQLPNFYNECCMKCQTL